MTEGSLFDQIPEEAWESPADQIPEDSHDRLGLLLNGATTVFGCTCRIGNDFCNCIADLVDLAESEVIFVENLPPLLIRAVTVEVASVYYMNVVDFVHIPDFIEESLCLDITLESISGHLCEAPFWQIRVQRLIAERNDEAPSAPL